MDFTMAMDIIIVACGVYVMFWAYQMKKNNKIPEALVGKGFPINRAKNPEGFIKATFPFTLMIGIILFAFGTLGALQIFVIYPWLDTLITIIMIAAILFYGSFLMKAQRKYLVGLEDKPKNKKRK